MSHTIEFDRADGILVCRLFGFLDEDAARAFGRDLAAAIAKIRGAGPLLYMVDNREGRVASPPAVQALSELLAEVKRPGDRTAILVSDSLSKLQAKRVATVENQVFVSEQAARTWLTAYS